MMVQEGRTQMQISNPKTRFIPKAQKHEPRPRQSQISKILKL